MVCYKIRKPIHYQLLDIFMLDEILHRFNLKYEDLTKAEQETLSGWLVALQNNAVTTEGVRMYFAQMRRSVEDELTKHNLSKEQDLFLKARLRNYMLVEDFLTGPEKAKAALEKALENIKRKN